MLKVGQLVKAKYHRNSIKVGTTGPDYPYGHVRAGSIGIIVAMGPKHHEIYLIKWLSCAAFGKWRHREVDFDVIKKVQSE